MRLISEALRDLRSHRGRSLLSALSLFVGVVAIVGVYTAGSIVKEVFVADAEQLHGRAITVTTRIPGGTMAARGLPATLTELKRQITAAGGSYALATDATAQVHDLGGKPESQTVALVAGRLDKVRRLPIIQGRWLPPDSRAFPGGLVLNMAARNVYGGVGTRLRVQLDARFEPYQQTVIGVVSDGLNGPMIYQSLPAALAYQPGVLPAGWSPQLLVHAPSVNEGVLRDAVRTVVADLGLDPGELDVQRADTVGQLVGNLHTTERAFLGVAAVTLLVAALGLLNIGLATVRDRTRELTIRRATGATRSRVFSLVLLSSVLLGLLAAAAALATALAVVTLVVPHVLNPASPIHAPSFPYSASTAGLAAALAASIAGGLAPALAATRVDMAQALRT